MSDVDVSGPSLADIQALISASTLGIPAFINSGTPMLVADLMANFPAGPSYLFKYARVSDLYSQANSVMICEASNGVYYWRPQRTDFAAPNTSTGGAVSLIPLVTAPVTVLTGSLGSNMTITPSTANVWPGATFTVISNGALNLLGINISGLIGGGTVPVLSGSSRTVTYIANSGWRAG